MKHKLIIILTPAFLATAVAAFFVGRYSVATPHEHPDAPSPYPHTHVYSQNGGATAASRTQAQQSGASSGRQIKSHALTPEQIADARRKLMERMQDPQYWDMASERIRTGLSQHYDDFFKKANLTPVETAQFMHLMTESALSYGKLLAEEYKKGNKDPNLDEVREKAKLVRVQYEAQLDQLLGEERAIQFKDYIRTLQEKAHANRSETNSNAKTQSTSDKPSNITVP